MKVLVVNPYPLFPLTHGGRVRGYRLAAGLANAGATVDVLFPWTPRQPLRKTRRDGVTLHPHRFCANVLPLALSERVVPPLVALASQPYAFGPRRRMRGFDGYDIVQFEFCATARWMGRAPRGAKIVYSAHNVEADYWAEKHVAAAWWGRMVRAVRELERRAVRASDLMLAPTALDAERLESLYGPPRRTAIVPQGHTQPLSPDDRRRLRSDTRRRLGLAPGDLAVLFIGGPAEHNREAIRFLEDRVLADLGDATRLVLVGGCSAPEPIRASRVLRLGFVPDLRPLLAAADVAVNPVARGSGQSLKVVEYLAAGLPVVATPPGARGIESNGHGALTVAERAAFAAAVRAAAARRERSYPAATEETSWSGLGRRLYGIFEELLA